MLVIMQISKLVRSKGENSQTFFNFLSTAITSGIAFVTMPIFTRLLGAEQYGLYAIYHSWLTIFTCFIGVNVFSSLGTGHLKYKDRYLKFRGSILLEGTLLGIAACLFFACIYPILRPAFRYSYFMFAALLLHALASFVTGFSNTAWVYEKRAARNMVVSSTLLISTSVLSILLLLNWKYQTPLFYGRVIGLALPHVIIALVIWVVLFREGPSGYNNEYWRYGLHFGMPMVFHLLSHQVLGQSDRLMMQWFSVSNSEIGIYSFFYSFVAILTTILNALNTSWTPFLYDDLAKENYDVLNKKVKNYVQIFTVMCLGFLLLSREVMKLFANSEYWPGAPIVPILVVVVYCTFFYQFAVNYEFFKEKPKFVAMGTVFAAISNIILNAIMIPKWGMYGAAVATLISYAMLAVMHTTIVKTWKLKRYPLSFTPVITGLVIVIVGCAGYYVLSDYIWLRWMLAVIIGSYLIVNVYRRKTIF